MTWKPKRPREPLSLAQLYDYALGALGCRMRTAAQLRRLLKGRAEPGDMGKAHIDAVLEKLQEQRYLDDRAFAADYTRLRQEGAKFGRRRVQQDLQQKGVDSELVTEALDTAYKNVNEQALAMSYMERKRMKPPTNEKESARVMRRLVTAGFSLSTVYKVLKQWGANEAVLAAVESGEADEVAAPHPDEL